MLDIQAFGTFGLTGSTPQPDPQPDPQLGKAAPWLTRLPDSPAMSETIIQSTSYNAPASAPAPLADLQIDAIWATDATLGYEQDLELNLHVSNTGTADATRAKTTFYWSPTDEFDINTAVRIDADGHGTLTAGESDTNEFESINYSNLARFGSGYVFGVIDAKGTTPESNEDNNISQAVYVEIDPGPEKLADLSVAHISADDTSLDLGQSLIVRLHVQNEGTARAQDTSSSFYWSPTDEFDFETAVLVDTDDHYTLGVGEYDDDEYEHISYSDLRDLGSGYVFAVIDAENTIVESNELNNVSEPLEFII